MQLADRFFLRFTVLRRGRLSYTHIIHAQHRNSARRRGRSRGENHKTSSRKSRSNGRYTKIVQGKCCSGGSRRTSKGRSTSKGWRSSRGMGKGLGHKKGEATAAFGIDSAPGSAPVPVPFPSAMLPLAQPPCRRLRSAMHGFTSFLYRGRGRTLNAGHDQ